MGHDHHHHHHGHSHGPDAHAQQSSKRILLALLLNFVFTIIEFIGAVLTGSVSIYANALHDLGDTLTLGVGFFLQRKSGQKPSLEFSYGYRRLSLVSALVTGLVLFNGSLYIFYESIQKLIARETPPDGQGMLILSIFGILINGIATKMLARGKSQNEKILTLHMMEDVLGWVATLIAGLGVYFLNWYFLDATLALLMTAYIFWNCLVNLKNTLLMFLQHTPRDIELDKIKTDLKNKNGIISVHDLHAWSLDGQHHILSMHVTYDDKKTSAPEIKKEIRHYLSHVGTIHCTIETETSTESCNIDCIS